MNNNINRTPTIQICDAIMGSGKTSAAINYMNAHPQERFIFISPLLSEDDRIVKNCPQLKFTRPGYTNAGQAKKSTSKSAHFLHLVQAGRNIATTHAMFDLFTDEMYAAIKQQDYTFIIDEEPALIETSNFDGTDIRALEDLGHIARHPDGTVDILKEQCPNRLQPAMRAAKNKRLLLDPVSDAAHIIWTMSPDCFAAFKKVIVLTYRFEASLLKGFLLTHGFSYEKIYIGKSDDGTHTFTDKPSYLPEYMGSMSRYIHIYEGELNKIGEKRHALSATQIRTLRKKNAITPLRSALRRYFTQETGQIHGKYRMWSTLGEAEHDLSQNGWTAAYLACNARATNSFAQRFNLAYLFNVFLAPDYIHFMAHHDLKADEDGYAVSTLVQWIWRSAIRNGQEIHLFIPSKRMRNLLKQWITDCEREYKEFYQTED